MPWAAAGVFLVAAFPFSQLQGANDDDDKFTEGHAVIYGICNDQEMPVVCRWPNAKRSAAESWAGGEEWDGENFRTVGGRAIYMMPKGWRVPKGDPHDPISATEDLVLQIEADGEDITPGGGS